MAVPKTVPPLETPDQVFLRMLQERHGFTADQAKELVIFLNQMKAGQTPRLTDEQQAMYGDFLRQMSQQWERFAKGVTRMRDLNVSQVTDILHNVRVSRAPEERVSVMAFEGTFGSREAPPQQVAYSVAVRGAGGEAGQSFRVVLNYELSGPGLPNLLRGAVINDPSSVVRITTMTGEEVSPDQFLAAISAEGTRVTVVRLPGQELTPRVPRRTG